MEQKIKYKYLPIGSHVLLEELESPDDFVQEGDVVVPLSVARDGILFRGRVLDKGAFAKKFNRGDIVLFNIVEGFRFIQIINGELKQFRIIDEQYLVPLKLANQEASFEN